MKLHGAAKRIYGGLVNRLSKQADFGVSKHLVKEAAKEAYEKEHNDLKGYNPSKIEGIYSIKTMENYWASMEPFSVWLAAHNVKNAAQVTPELAGVYLQERQKQGLSAWTVSRDMSAINKALGFDLSKKDLGLKYRHKDEITRDRRAAPNRTFSDYQEQIDIVKATGIRRQSVLKITPNDCVYNAAGLVVGIRVVEKGGRERVAPVLNAHKEKVTAIVGSASDKSKPLFSRYDSHIQSHRYRAEYCSALLAQLEQEHAQGKPMFGGDLDAEKYIHLSEKDKKVGEVYRGHPTQVVAAVSGAMGHNRLEIIFTNYLYKT